MNILHVCLCGQFNENFSYQDNLITKYHSLLGHKVNIIAPVLRGSDKDGSVKEVSPGTQVINNNITLHRLPYKCTAFKTLVSKLRLYKGLLKKVKELKPDFIFIHGTQFLDIFPLIRYIKSVPGITVVADNHSDYYNSARNWLSMNILHKIIWKRCAKSLEPYCHKFFGVTPIRCEFLHDVYGIAKENIDLLPLGADDEMLSFENKLKIIEDERKRYNISSGDFLIVTGGKIDLAKNIHLLLESVKELKFQNVKVVFFGSVSESMKVQITALTDNVNVIYAGWMHSSNIYKLLVSADLLVFPGSHSVLWEQACATGVPCIFNRIKGMEHVDLGGNCILINGGNIEEIKTNILNVVTDIDLYDNLSKNAKNKSNTFLFSNIAKKSLLH